MIIWYDIIYFLFILKFSIYSDFLYNIFFIDDILIYYIILYKYIYCVQYISTIPFLPFCNFCELWLQAVDVFGHWWSVLKLQWVLLRRRQWAGGRWKREGRERTAEPCLTKRASSSIWRCPAILEWIQVLFCFSWCFFIIWHLTNS